jgi:hypothetical protein
MFHVLNFNQEVNMFSLQRILSSTALVLVLNACGSQVSESQRHSTDSSSPRDRSNEQASIGATSDMVNGNSSFARTQDPNQVKSVVCSYSVNGKTWEGKSKEECDRLKAAFEKSAQLPTTPLPGTPSASKPSDTNKQVACSFNVNGQLYEGKNQAECDKLKADLGIDTPSLPAPAPNSTPAPKPSTSSSVEISCAFNINGKLFEGKSQAECDKLKQDLGFQF